MELLQQRRFVPNLDIHGVDQQKRMLFACVVAALEDAEAQQLPILQFKALKDGRPQGSRQMIQWRLEFSQSEYGKPVGRRA